MTLNRLREPYLNDSRTLAGSAFPAFPNTMAAVRRYLRSLKDHPFQSVWILEKNLSSDEPVEPDAVVVVDRASIGGRAMVHVHPNMLVYCTDAWVQSLAEALAEWLKGHHEILQVQLMIPADASGSLSFEPIEALGFTKMPSTYPFPLFTEALLPRPDRAIEITSYRYLSWEWERGLHGGRYPVFVPFETGIVMAITDTEAVRSIQFMDYDQVPTDPWIMNQGWLMGYVTDRGRFIAHHADADLEHARVTLKDYPYITEIVYQALSEYLHGTTTDLNLPYATDEGTAFQRQVWRVLETIPYGSTRNYEEVAEAMLHLSHRDHEPELTEEDKAMTGQKLARAVGAACKANPLPILIPCHRVIGKNGRILGYSSDPKHKSWLLWEEQVHYMKMHKH